MMSVLHHTHPQLQTYNTPRTTHLTLYTSFNKPYTIHNAQYTSHNTQCNTHLGELDDEVLQGLREVPESLEQRGQGRAVGRPLLLDLCEGDKVEYR